MKINRYSYIVNIGESLYVIFNGMTKDFIVIHENTIDSYEKILSNPDQYITTHPTIIKELRQSGIIVEDDYDELSILRDERKKTIQSPIYKTLIIPTFDCNYKCWYCKQRHIPSQIDNAKLQLIIRHVKKYLIENDILEYNLSWFGGEPLTQPGIIDYITNELHLFCQDNDIIFTGSITTNGALLTPENILMLKRNHINFFQIAIDGDKKSHDNNKFDSINPSSFDLVLGNVVKLATIHEGAQIVLRINHTPEVIKDTHLVDEINERIPRKIRNRITIDLQHIWQIDERKFNIEHLKAIAQKIIATGYQLSASHVFDICYVDRIHQNMIYYNGGVEKCDNIPLNSLRGFIDENGDIIWKETPSFLQYDVLSDDSPCSKCSYYPICYCGCPVAREKIISKNGHIICNFAGDFSKLEYRIKDFCWRMLYKCNKPKAIET